MQNFKNKKIFKNNGLETQVYFSSQLQYRRQIYVFLHQYKKQSYDFETFTQPVYNYNKRYGVKKI